MTTHHSRGTGVPPVNAAPTPNPQTTVRIRQGAYLPHWTQDGGIYFVTFRLADALPQSVVRAWNAERDEIARRASRQGRKLTIAEQNRLSELFSERVEKLLDAGQGKCWLNRPEVADLVAGALQHFDGSRYTRLAWCVMPNHVHVVFQPTAGYELKDILHSWKSFTAHRATKLLKIGEPFWQPESYDHLIRDDAELWQKIEYILNNPAAANLRDWRWVGAHLDLANYIECTSAVEPLRS
jgi:REP element-mobilizing transposase RayT